MRKRSQSKPPRSLRPSTTTTPTTTISTTTRSTTSASRLAPALLALALAACGGASQQPASRTTAHKPHLDRKAGAPRAVPVRPLEVVVMSRRAGGSLEVTIQAVGRGHGENEAFEDTGVWEIAAQDHHGRDLRRIMNGPRRVDREPVGSEDGSQWDVKVRYSVFFELPAEVPRVAVRVAVPAAEPVEIQSELR